MMAARRDTRVQKGLKPIRELSLWAEIADRIEQAA